MIVKKELADGTARYTVRVGHGGRQQTFTRLKDAQEAEATLKRNAARSKAGLEEVMPDITFAQLVREYTSFKGGLHTHLTEMLVRPKKKWGNTRIRQLRRAPLADWLHNLTNVRTDKPLAPKSKQHIRDAIHQVLAYAVEEGYMRKNPLHGVTIPGAFDPPADLGFDSWKDVELIASKMSRVTDKALTLFLAATGLRPEEAFALRWSAVDTREGTGNVLSVIVDGNEKGLGKTDAALRPFVLIDRAVAALNLLPRPIHDQLIFTNTQGGPIRLDNWRRRVWNPAVENAGLPHRSPYKLRHTFATLAVEDGTPMELVAIQLGHRGTRTTEKVYGKHRKPSHDRLRDLLNAAHANEAHTSLTDEADGAAE